MKGMIYIDKEIVAQGIRKFTGTIQALKAVEEMSELSAILVKQTIHSERDLTDKIAEELADVYITLEAIKDHYKIADDRLSLLVYYKQKRFKENHL